MTRYSYNPQSRKYIPSEEDSDQSATTKNDAEWFTDHSRRLFRLREPMHGDPNFTAEPNEFLAVVVFTPVRGCRFRLCIGDMIGSPLHKMLMDQDFTDRDIAPHALDMFRRWHGEGAASYMLDVLALCYQNGGPLREWPDTDERVSLQ